jgi:hypothetical protein
MAMPGRKTTRVSAATPARKAVSGLLVMTTPAVPP